MKLTSAQKLAEQLMKRHGLIQAGWKFTFDRAKSRLGVCFYATRTISISKFMCEAADEETVRQTILHEIAHAMLPIKNSSGRTIGHGKPWKDLAASIGYTGTRLSENPYLAGKKAGTHRLSSVTRRQNHSTFIPGSAVRIVMRTNSKYNGVRGTVEKVNRKTYSVKLRTGQKLHVPHYLVSSAVL